MAFILPQQADALQFVDPFPFLHIELQMAGLQGLGASFRGLNPGGCVHEDLNLRSKNFPT